MKAFYPIRELVGVAGLPSTARGVRKAIKVRSWTTREIAGNGGKALEVAFTALPKATQSALIGRIATEAAANSTLSATSASVDTQTGGGLAACAASTVVVVAAQPVSVSSQALAGQLVVQPELPHMPGVIPANGLSDAQRKIAAARAVLVRYVLQMAASLGGAGYTNAIRLVASQSKMAQLPVHVRDAAMLAHGKSRDGRVLGQISFSTLQKWVLNAAKHVGESSGGGVKQLLHSQKGESGALLPATSLAPQKQGRKQAQAPAWTGQLLAEWRDPRKPTLMTCVRSLIDRGVLPVSEQVSAYHAARRMLDRMGVINRESGRMSPKSLKALKPFIRRDTSSLNPGDVYTADGHTFDAEINHPINGKPFRPEVTAVIDAATRRWMGWSLGLKENQLTVIEALLAACSHGLCTVFYVDNGVGYKGGMVADPHVGLTERLGIQLTHSLPYNAQGKGLMERFWQNLVELARSLPSYMGKDADQEHKNEFYKQSRRDVATQGFSPLLPSFRQLADLLNHQLHIYNNRPHRALPKIFDIELKKARHMSPNEAWELGTKRMTTALPTLSQLERHEFYRPQVERIMQRCEILLHGARYFCKNAEQWHGKTVAVSFDVANPENIWVYDADGYYICQGDLDANKRDYFPVSFLQQAAIKRVKGMQKRAIVKVENAQAELSGVHEGAMRWISDDPIEQFIPDAQPDAIQSLPQHQTRPIFQSFGERYEWVMRNKSKATDTDWRELADWVTTEEYQMLEGCFESENIAWTGLPEGVEAYQPPQLLKVA